MQSLSALLGKSKKQGMFQQAYVISIINKGLTEIQMTLYPKLNSEFEAMDRFIIPVNQGNYNIKLRIYDNSFKTFVKTEISTIDLLLREFLSAKGLDKLQFEIIVS
jgi:hypothetical protein